MTYTGLNKVSTPFGALVVKGMEGGLAKGLKERLEQP